MARLPDFTALGVRDPNSVRGVPTFDGKDYEAAALGKMGEALADAGAVGYRYVRQEQKEANTTDLARATSGWAADAITTKSDFQNDQDFKTLGPRFQAQLETQRQQRAAGIQDPGLRQKFLDGTVDDVARNNVWAKQQAQTTEAGYSTAAFTERATKLQEAYAKTADETERKKLEIGVAAEAQTNVAKGWWTPQQANDFVKNWREGGAITALKQMPVGEQIANLGGWEKALVQKESSGNPRIQNGLGFTGLYQFGAPRLETLGLYKPGANENLQTWNQDAMSSTPGKWSGSLSIPGFPNVRTIDDFRANPEAQNAAFRLHVQKMDQEIAELGLGKYVGQTVRGVPVTKEGIYAMIHLGGAGGAQKALQSGGAANAKDANGSSLLDYASMAARAGSGPAAAIPESKRLDLLQRAENQQEQDFRQAQTARVQIAAEQAEHFERGMLDANVGLRPMMSRTSIESDPTLDEPRRNTLLRQYDATTRGLREKAAAVEQFNAGALDGDPYNTDKRSKVALAYGQMIPDPAVLLRPDEAGQKARIVTTQIAKRTGIVPDDVGTLIRGTLVDTDPARVEQGLRLASEITRGNQHAFTPSPNGQQIEQAGAEYDYHLSMGRSPQQAATIIAERNDPAWKAKMPGFRSTEATAEFLKGLRDEDTVTEARKRLATGWFGFGRPDMAFDDRQLSQIGSDFQREALLEYQRTGNKDLASKLAMDRLVGDPATGKRGVYATTSITGTPTIMKYAPEAAPGYPAVGGSKDYVADQYIDDVKALTGKAIKRTDIVVLPVNALAEQQQARAFNEGRPVPYLLGYRDDKGVIQALPTRGGVGFVADPELARSSMGEKVRAEQAQKREAVSRAEAIAEEAGVANASPDYTLGAD